jgi:hypothetical protein
MAIKNQAKWVGVDNIAEDKPLKIREYSLKDYLSWQGSFSVPGNASHSWDWDEKKWVKYIDGGVGFTQPYRIEVFDGLDATNYIVVFSREYNANEKCIISWHRKGYFTRIKITNLAAVEGTGLCFFTCKLY